MKESFSETMRKYKERQKKERFNLVLGSGATLIVIMILQSILFKKLPKLDEEA